MTVRASSWAQPWKVSRATPFCLLDGVPILFDCIEFDQGLATIDVPYDLAAAAPNSGSANIQSASLAAFPI
jgi:hypothetical protein